MSDAELVALTWSDVLVRDNGQVQLSVVGKGGVVRQVLLPEVVSRSLLSLRGDTGAIDAVFASSKGGGRITERAVLGTGQARGCQGRPRGAYLAALAAHAHSSHAIDRDATLPEVQATLGHSNIATTSGYLHARRESSSGLKLVGTSAPTAAGPC